MVYASRFGPIVIVSGYFSCSSELTAGELLFTLPSTIPAPSYTVGGSTVEVTSDQGNYGVEYRMNSGSRQIRCVSRYRHYGTTAFV